MSSRIEGTFWTSSMKTNGFPEAVISSPRAEGFLSYFSLSLVSIRFRAMCSRGVKSSVNVVVLPVWRGPSRKKETLSLRAAAILFSINLDIMLSKIA
jgi:hypothetical protein